ncbi:MAG TPA: DUF3857 domain-containing protein, partial [Arachidicoccus soli]|nr:DUF3857 domain-containing protein [Arachidicoccus soli]
MRNLKLLFVFLCLTTYSLSQDYINSYDWETPAKLWTVSQSQKNEDEIQLLKKEICQYVYENNSLVEYDLFHIRYYLGNKTGIIKNNKVYIPINENEQLIKTKARVILPGGKIITFDKEDMKEGYEDNVKYNFFALNGLVPGCEVEYIYVIKTAPNLMGVTYTFQEEDTTYRQSLELISPPNIVLISKSYNGLAEMQKDTSLAPRNFLKLELDTVPGLADEPSAFMDKYYQKVEYKMDRNTIAGKRNIVDYGKIARTLQQNANPELTKDDKKALNAIFRAAQLNNKDSAINNIEALENYLKTNFVFKTESNPELFSIAAIYKNKAYSELGAIRIYTGICNMLNIKIQPVLTCDRTETNFDKKFASYNYLQKGLLYFPEIDAYLDPTESSSRLGLIDAEYTGIVGLHVKTVSMGDYKTGLAVFKVIPTSSAETNLTDMNIHVTFGDDFDNFSMHYLTKRYGLINNIIQNYYDKMDDEQKKKFEDNVLKYYDNYQVNNLKIANASPTD